jgi:hypothetical protein
VHQRCMAGTSKVHLTFCTGRMSLPGGPVSGERVKKRAENPICVCVRKEAAAGGTSTPMTDPSSSRRRCPSAGAPVPGCPAEAGAGTTVTRAIVPNSRDPARGRPFPGAGCRAGPGSADLTGRAESGVDVCGPGREASPPCRPATRRADARSGARATPPATARDPVSCAADLPLRQGRAARHLPPRRSTSRAGALRGGPGAGGGRT